MKKLMGVAVLGATVGVAAVAAQPPEERSGRGRHGTRAVVEYLDLTEEQQSQWTTLREQHRDEVKALREEGRDIRHRLQEALEADAPDAEVGVAAKAAHAHRLRMKQARESFEARLKSLLTPEQRERFEAFQAARSVGRKGRGDRGPRGAAASPVEG